MGSGGWAFQIVGLLVVAAFCVNLAYRFARLQDGVGRKMLVILFALAGGWALECVVRELIRPWASEGLLLAMDHAATAIVIAGLLACTLMARRSSKEE